jgi:hypothetical protein
MNRGEFQYDSIAGEGNGLNYPIGTLLSLQVSATLRRKTIWLYYYHTGFLTNIATRPKSEVWCELLSKNSLIDRIPVRLYMKNNTFLGFANSANWPTAQSAAQSVLIWDNASDVPSRLTPIVFETEADEIRMTTNFSQAGNLYALLAVRAE